MARPREHLILGLLCYRLLSSLLLVPTLFLCSLCWAQSCCAVMVECPGGVFVKVGTDGVGKERSSTLLHVVGDGDWICQGWSSQGYGTCVYLWQQTVKGEKSSWQMECRLHVFLRK